ncbi:MAG: chemotaxis protein MotB [Rubellimicrobium sp.]|nr:chemotaxis protein MotB [Rubellimicrobium sp.]
MGTAKNAPVIIKRKKNVIEGGHHGGAWKVAYADFVTAMMAFFMLMWLLGATTEEQRKGIADYFAPSLPIARSSGGSDGAFGGNNPTSREAMTEVGQFLADGITGQADSLVGSDSDGTAALAAAETVALEEIEDALLGRGGESLISDQTLRHVVTRVTDEGLVVEVFALPGAPLFATGTAEALPPTREVVAAIAGLSRMVMNPYAIAAYVPSQPVVLAGNPVWHLSMDRADTVRALMEDGGADPMRLRRVTGHGDRNPATADAMAERNDRFEITLLRNGRRR